MERLEYIYKRLLIFDFLHILCVSDNRYLPLIKNVSIHYSLKSDGFDNRKLLKTLLFLEVLSGQRPVLVKAKSSFDIINIRQGFVVSCKVTLNKKNSFSFFDKFALIVLPNMVRFEGFNVSGFDKNGNFHQTVSEPFTLFPELLKGYDLFKGLKGCLQINISIKKSNLLKSLTFLSLIQLKFLY